MRSLTVLCLVLIGGWMWAQLPEPQLKSAMNLVQKLVPAKPSRSDGSHKRVQNAYVLDSLYSDTYGGSGNWLEKLLTTYAYYPNSTQPMADSLFRKSGTAWVDSAETRYYYTTSDWDSIRVTYISPDGINWSPSDSTAFSYTLSGSVTLQTSISYTHDGTAWNLGPRQRIWYSAGNPDSSSYDTFNVNTNAWDQIAFARYKYAGPLLDSVIVQASLSGGVTLIFEQKYFYDAAGRPNYVYDTTYVPSFSLGIQATEDFITYTSPTSQLVAVDSFVLRSYYPPPPVTDIQVARHSYDANGNLSMIIYEACAPACIPLDRERYAYKMLTTSVHSSAVATHSLCGRACERVAVPESWNGMAYELYSLNGQRLSQGTLESTLVLPTQPGMYILLTRGQAYRLHVLP